MFDRMIGMGFDYGGKKYLIVKKKNYFFLPLQLLSWSMVFQKVNLEKRIAMLFWIFVPILLT